jgi:hypothetical protein
MKTSTAMIKQVLLGVLAWVAFSSAGFAQDSAATASLESRIKDKHFVFVAQTALPQRGSIRQLTSYYDLRVSNDSLVSNLPYFGRAYSAPIDPSQGGLNFTSTSFNYDVKDGKKSGWDIRIKPNKGPDIQEILLSVFDNKTASLQVISTNREPITFRGYIK